MEVESEPDPLPCSAACGPFDHIEMRISTLRFELERISKWSNGPRIVLYGAAWQRIWFQVEPPLLPLLICGNFQMVETRNTGTRIEYGGSPKNIRNFVSYPIFLTFLWNKVLLEGVFRCMVFNEIGFFFFPYVCIQQ
jgi:hypothetical protein